MAIISGIFHQEKKLEKMADLLEQSGYSDIFIAPSTSTDLPVPGSFLIPGLQREPHVDVNFGISPGVPLPFFLYPSPPGLRLTVQVKKEDQSHVMQLMKRGKAEQIQVH